jgi:hypothetical protein
MNAEPRTNRADGGIGDARRVGELPKRVRPDGEHEHDAARQQPEQRVALLEPAAADQLEHDE